MVAFIHGIITFIADHPRFIYVLNFLIVLYVVWYLDIKRGLLRDMSTAKNKPYSWARVQTAWWTIIILSAFFSIMLTKNVVPVFSANTIILLGLSAGTLATGRAIDISDQNNDAITRNQDTSDSQGMVLDILSDGDGVTIHRLQTVLFNLAFGVWVAGAIYHRIGLCLRVPSIADCNGLLQAAGQAIDNAYNYIIPDISDRNLVLLGLSSATYAAMKAGENKTTPPPTDNNTDTDTTTGTGPNANANNSNTPPPAAGEDAAPRDTSMF